MWLRGCGGREAQGESLGPGLWEAPLACRGHGAVKRCLCPVPSLLGPTSDGTVRLCLPWPIAVDMTSGGSNSGVVDVVNWWVPHVTKQEKNSNVATETARGVMQLISSQAVVVQTEIGKFE